MDYLPVPDCRGRVKLKAPVCPTSLSLPLLEAADCVQKSLHLKLDMAVRGDGPRLRQRNAAIHAAALRHLALYLLEQEKSLEAGVKAICHQANGNNIYLNKVVMGSRGLSSSPPDTLLKVTLATI